jgi:Uma2 family endonuclease
MSASTLTSMTPIEALADPSSTEEGLYLISSEQYCAMIEAGILPEDAYVELWEGRIVEKMAKNIPHDVSGAKLNTTLVQRLPNGWFVGNENTVIIGPRSAPLPDLVVLRGTPDDYWTRRAVPADIGLIVELAETSLKKDRGPKMKGYAAAGIPEYWVVNLIENVVHVFREPVPAEGKSGWTKTYVRGETIHLALPGAEPVAFAVDEMVRPA